MPIISSFGFMSLFVNNLSMNFIGWIQEIIFSAENNEISVNNRYTIAILKRVVKEKIISGKINKRF